MKPDLESIEVDEEKKGSSGWGDRRDFHHFTPTPPKQVREKCDGFHRG
jgi:hypothetical protein